MSRAARTVRTLAIAAWVRSTRELAGWSQAEMATQAGLSQPVVSRIEAGTKLPDAWGLGQLARAACTDVAGMLAAVERTEAAMLRAARALVDDEGAGWDNLLPQLGEGSAQALALAAARAWLPFHPKPAKRKAKPVDAL